MLGRLTGGAANRNFPGLLVDFDHSSHDPAQPTTAAGGSAGWSIAGTGFMRRSAGRTWARGADRRAVPAGVAGVESRGLRSVDGADGGWTRCGASAPAAAGSAGADE